LTGLFFAGAIAVAASLLKKPEGLPWSLTAVDVVDGQTDGAHLLVKGEGLHKGVKAILVPDIAGLESFKDSVVLSLPLYQFASVGRLAVVSARDRRLLIIDVTDALNPRVMGGLKLNQPDFGAKGSTTSLALVGSKVVASRSNVGLALVDVSDPAEPQNAPLLDMQTYGERVYVVSNTDGLFMVTQESNRLISQRIPGSRVAARLAVQNGRLVTLAYDGELVFYNLDGQGRPHLADTLKLESKIRDLVLTQESLFICTSSGELLEFNLEAWPRPVLAGKLDLTGRPLKLEWNELTHQLYSILVGSAVAIIDISRPGKPQVEGLVPLDRGTVSVCGQGNYLFILGLNGLRAVSTHDFGAGQPLLQTFYPLSPALGGSTLLPWGSTLFIHNRGDLRLLSAGRGDRRNPDVTQPESPPFLVLPDKNGVRLHAIREGMPAAEILNTIPVDDEVTKTEYGTSTNSVMKAFWRGGNIYVLSRSKVSIFGVDDAGKVFSREEFKLESHVMDMVWLSGGFLVLATDEPGIKVVDVRHSGAYRVVGEYPLAKYQRKIGAIKSLLVDGARLYAARGRLGVEIYDLVNPASPRLLQRIDTPGHAIHLSMYDGLLLVADTDRGAFIIDVSGERALSVGSYLLPTSCVETTCNENGFYVINSVEGVLRVPSPLRLTAADFVSEGEAELTVPSGVAPGRYRLTLYDEEGTASYVVALK